MTTTDDIKRIIADRGGVLASGSHDRHYGDPECPLCVTEAVAAAMVEAGQLDAITDDPEAVGLPDIRSLNDAAWSSRQAATPHLLRLIGEYMGWGQWSDGRRSAVMERVALDTVRRVLPRALRAVGLTDEAHRCSSAQTLAEAREAANVASVRAATQHAEAARAAARAAAACAARASYTTGAAAADAATLGADAALAVAATGDADALAAHRDANPDTVLAEAVNVWCEAADKHKETP